jgi:putative aldouronate transport system permease protein
MELGKSKITHTTIRKTRIKRTNGERIFSVFNYTILILLGLSTAFPFYTTLVNSVSPPQDFIFKDIILWPSKFETQYYRFILGEGSAFIKSLKVTIYLTVVGTVANMLFTAVTAFVLSQRKLPFRSQITLFMVFTMFFGGGMIPGYLLMRGLHLLNSINGLILPGLINTFYVMLLRNFLMTIPPELTESAIIDGCSEVKLLIKIILPLSIPALSTFTLFYAVAQWNTFYSAVLYITDYSKQPLQVYLRQVLYDVTVEGDRRELRKLLEDGYEPPADALKATTIMCATLPILIVYPFLQKYFVKGMMMGSLKG